MLLIVQTVVKELYRAVMLATRYGQLRATGAQSNAINLIEVPIALK